VIGQEDSRFRQPERGSQTLEVKSLIHGRRLPESVSKENVSLAVFLAGVDRVHRNDLEFGYADLQVAVAQNIITLSLKPDRNVPLSVLMLQLVPGFHHYVDVYCFRVGGLRCHARGIVLTGNIRIKGDNNAKGEQSLIVVETSYFILFDPNF